MRRLFALSAALLSLPALVVVAAPAQAATPSCTSFYSYGNTTGTTYADVPTVGSSSTPNPTCILGMNNQGPAVAALQRSLKYCYVSGLAVDGVFGSQTRNALITAQKRGGVSPDGVYGPQTRKAMLWIYVSVKNGQPFTCGTDPVY